MASLRNIQSRTSRGRIISHSSFHNLFLNLVHWQRWRLLLSLTPIFLFLNFSYNHHQLLLQEQIALDNISYEELSSSIKGQEHSSQINLEKGVPENESLPLIKPTSPPHSINATKKYKAKIIAFTDEYFLPIGIFWYDRLTSLGYDEHILIATDEETILQIDSLNKKNDLNNSTRIRVEKHLIEKGSLRSLWYERIQYVKTQIQEEGTSILLTDVDNIFMKFVSLDRFEEEPYDVFHAYETKFPLEVYNQMGFVVCGGMTYFKADKNDHLIRNTRDTTSTTSDESSPISKLMDIILAACIQQGNSGTKKCNDQVILNSILADMNTSPTHHLRMNWSHNVKDDPMIREEMMLHYKNYTPEPNTAFDNLLAIGMTGQSQTTGHRVKIWDRSFAYRGSMEITEEDCPDNNWVAMPVIQIAGIERKVQKKLQVMNEWIKKCGATTIESEGM